MAMIPLAETSANTVVAVYDPESRRSEAYQSEAELEAGFIDLLVQMGYGRPEIHDEAGLIRNLRMELERLNGVAFTDGEWKRFFSASIAGKDDSVVTKIRRIQEDHVQPLRRDDGTTKNIWLLDKENVHNNSLQVINQYAVNREDGARYDNRYDVTILVNGLPLVHVELKRRGVALREAFNQIQRYDRDSFGAGHGLFEYVQVYVISNGTETRYYSSTTRQEAARAAGGKGARGKASRSFEFTSYWADGRNRPILDLVDFARTFFARHTILNVLARYCVFTVEETLLVMRPYQIAATEAILNRVETAGSYRKYGRTAGGGYIWHTTGSGKTLTSFKTARLASRMDGVDKVLFVVDRKDLDYQTMREYDRFEKGCANSNTSTRVLARQLADDGARIIITTIQKLSRFIAANPRHAVYGKRVVMIFDECHRSQFGEMHAAVVNRFRKYHLFGFTGTPIFAKNTASGTNAHYYRTTEETFGDRLHAYTVMDAIRDRNVLRFHVEYMSTMDCAGDVEDRPVPDIDRQKAFEAPERVRKVTEYILRHFARLTYRDGESYALSVLRNVGAVAAGTARDEERGKSYLKGFNAILATASISMAKRYYTEFRKQQEGVQAGSRLRVALIYSFAANEEALDGLGEENSEGTERLDKPSRDFLEDAIRDYNAMFTTNYDTSGDRFQNYYKDVSLRMKNRELDLLIVVNMFLTGFDAPAMNTLWVDKDLRMHGLMQAFSRTNRILNSVKRFGNIVCFRPLRERVDEAVALFSDPDAESVVILRPFTDYYDGYTDDSGEHFPGYTDIVSELRAKFPLRAFPLAKEKDEKGFIALFGSYLRMRNFLRPFAEFEGRELMTEGETQDYSSHYLDLRDKIAATREKAADVSRDIVFEIELIRQVEINIEYILALLKKYHDSNCEDRELLVRVRRAIDASPQLRSKKELIEKFIARLNRDSGDVQAEWQAYVEQAREQEIQDVIATEHLKEQGTRQLLERAFRDGELHAIGTGIDSIMPPMSRFGAGGDARVRKKRAVIDRLRAVVERFLEIASPFRA